MKKEVKQFDPKAKSFMANGHTYFVSTKFSITRYEEYEKLQPKLTFDLDFDSMFKELKATYEKLNQSKFADSAVKIYNLMAAINDVRNEKRIHPALLMAALAINREDEDATVFDQKLQEEKINDWRVEGYDIEGFFYFALGTIKGFAKEYNEFTETGMSESLNLRK